MSFNLPPGVSVMDEHINPSDVPWLDCVEIGGATLYHGDCLDILPTLDRVEALIVDPVWPNVPEGAFLGWENPQALFENMWCAIDLLPARAVIWMRNDCDPRFLSVVPDELTFRQSMWMRYAAVGHRGRFLTGNDVAYAFGDWPKSELGRRSIPAQGPVQTTSLKGTVDHPAPRSVKHAEWLVRNWGDNEVLDPFMGSGTTGIACANLGRKFIGIEIERKYFDIACERIDAAYAQGRLFA